MRTRSIYRNGEVIALYKDGSLVYALPEFYEEKPVAPMVMDDIQPYRSMIDGSEIGSRSRHREHLRAHGCVEVGDQTHHLKPKPVQTPPGLKERIAQIAYSKLRY